MKKYIGLFVLFFLISCSSNQQEIEDAKKELLQNTSSEIQGDRNSVSEQVLPTQSVENTGEIQEVVYETQETVYEDVQDAFQFLERDISDLSCETLTTYLGNHSGWFYWNTCRPLEKDISIYFNVLSLEEDQYKYERHYVNFEKGIYATVLLETGWPLGSDDLSAKNQELRDKNFESISEYDSFFRWL